MTCDQLVLTCVGWPNGEKLAYEFELDQSQRKSSQISPSRRKWMRNETQVERMSKT